MKPDKLRYVDFPRKAKKAIKRNFIHHKLNTLWFPNEVKISVLSKKLRRDKPIYKGWIICEYKLTAKKA